MADKKISQLPKINALSGSNGGEIIVPLVHDGTTQKMEIGAFAKYISQHSAQTGSANTFYGTQTFTGNVNVNGRLTVHEIYANYETASIIFSSGSNIFGDQASDIHTFVGTINLNGLALGDEKLMAQTASQAAVNLGISSTTGSINTTTSSFDSVFQRISSTTGSINTTTSSFDSVFLGISSVSGAINTTTSSFDSEFAKIGSTTASLHFTTSSLNSFTGSIIGQNNTISTFTSSVNFATQSLNTQTGSQDLVNRGISSVTGSINTTTSSFDSVFLRISSTTGSINTTTSSFDSVFLRISSTTGSINTTTSSFDSVFLGISSVTGSLIGITNTLMAFTAALDNTYATDAQLYQLYQATASIHFATQSLNTQTGSQDLVNRGISSVTGSINTTTSSFDSVFQRISSTTGSINTTTSSFDSVFLRISSTTGSINTTTSSFNNEFVKIGLTTSSIHFATQSLNAQTGSQDSVNLTISNVTSSFRAEIGGIEAYTASLKSQAIVSSSTQISNYYKFAETASANTFYGTQSVTGSVRISGSIDDIKYIDFDTVAPATGIARLGWDDGEGTLTIGLSGGNVNIPIGVVSFETAYNEDSSSISKGDVVRISGAQGNRVAIKKAHNHNDDGSATTIAIAAETIGVGAEGKIIESGPLKGIDTTAFGEGDLLYLSSTPGGITNIKPHPPYHEVRIGVAQRIHASVGIINVKVDNGYEIDELHNVLIHTASLANKQLLAYSGSVWANQTISELGIAETASLNPVLAYTASLKGAAIVSSSTQISNYYKFAETSSANTFYGNQTITGSLLVTGSLTISSGSIKMPNRPGVRVTGAGGAKVATTALSGSYLNVDWQQSNAWDNSTGTFTAPIAGLYQVNVVVRTNSNSLGTASQLIVYKNNTGGTTGTPQIMIEFAANTTMNHAGGSTISYLNVNDTLKMVVAQGEISFDSNDNFSVAYIG